MLKTRMANRTISSQPSSCARDIGKLFLELYRLQIQSLAIFHVSLGTVLFERISIERNGVERNGIRCSIV